MQRKTLHPAILLVLLLPCSFNAYSQTRELDSLATLAKSKTGSGLLDSYVAIANLARYSHADTSFNYARRAWELSEQLAYPLGKITANNAMGRALTTQGNYFLAQKYYNKALDLAQAEKNDSFVCRNLLGIGNCLWQLGKHAEALEYNFRALRLAEQKGFQTDIAMSKTGIGMVYQTQDKLPLAEKYISEALVILKQSPFSISLLNAMHTMANIYGMQGKIKEAFAIDEEGLALAEKTNNDFSKSLFYDNMANCFLFGSPPDYVKAKEFFIRTLLIDSSYGNKKQMSDSYKNLGIVYLYQKKYSEAIPYFIRSATLAQESGFVQGQQKTYEELARTYQRSGMQKEAYETLGKSMVLKDSLFNANSDNRMNELQAFYETEKQKQQIELQQTQLSRKNTVIAGTIISAILLGLLGLSAWHRYRLRQKARLQGEIMKQQELATKAVIEAEEEERQRIARDLHDGIGQMMSAAKMNLSAFESDIRFENRDQQLSFEKIIGLVDESCKEIRTVSHNMMPNALLKSSLASAVRDFIDKIDKKTLKIHIYTEGLDERLDSNVETVLYRVIQECVNNVIKHANASTLDISIARDKDGISATIEDNGKGFDTTDKEKFEGIGLKNIVTRVEYLKGSVDFDSAPGRGTVVAVHVPVAA